MKKLLKNIKSLWLRFRSDTPKFFKKLRNIGITTSVILYAISWIPVVPPWAREILRLISTATGTAGVTAQSAVKDEKE